MSDKVVIVRDRGGYDYEVLSSELTTNRERDETFEYLMKIGYRLTELDVMYVESGRLASWVYPSRRND